MNESDKMAFFFEIFDAGLPRLGPGEEASTRRAFDVLTSHGLGRSAERSTRLRVLDLGCGNGAQTIEVAKRVEGTILAIDFHQPYLDQLLLRAEKENVAEKIQVRLADMAGLDLVPNSFDLIWSEGALYSVGFLNGLDSFRSALVPAGLFAVTELCWFGDDAPTECRQFFADEYPDMSSVSARLDAIEDRGYEVLDHFSLPESAWWNYYRPLGRRLEEVRPSCRCEPEKLAIVEFCQTEIDTYRKYSEHYGYEFFLLRRSDRSVP